MTDSIHTKLTDEEIKKIINENYSIANVKEIRKLITEINSETLESWEKYQDKIDDGSYESIINTADSVVIIDHSGTLWSNYFRFLERDREIRSNTKRTIIQIHHKIASLYTGKYFSNSSPVVIKK